uniref:RhLWD1 protein n=1 Tax=Epiophlebia superstes TaxID=126247 RepID=A0A0C6G528_9ODON|nr:opsin, long-wavelength sensitive type [Epiophlebia superstes]
MATAVLMAEPRIAVRWGGPSFSNHTVVDMVPQEMLPYIDPHWYQFAPMNPLWHGILGFVIAVLGFISWTGNGVVIYVFSCTRSLRSPSNLLVVNLAFSDFFMMIAMCPLMLVNCYYQTWVFGPLMCQLYAYAGSLFGCASIWTMVTIALDRYNVIVKGLSGKPLTIKRALLWIAIVWVHAAIWTTLPMVGWNRYVPEGNMTACGTDYLTKDWFHRSYILIYSFFCYWLPLFVIIYSYTFIVQAVYAHEKGMREQAKKMNVTSLRSPEAQNTSAECKLAKIALMTISLWFMAWTPYLIINFAGIFETMTISPLVTIWGSVFAKANAVYNPIVYGISHPKYRVALNEKLPFLVCGGDGKSPSDAQSTTSVGSAASAEEEKA